MGLDLESAPLLLLERRIRSKEATVAVVGLGYVGLPLLVAVSDAGFPVVGIEVDPQKVDLLRSGQSYIGDVPDSAVSALESRFDSDPATLLDAEIMVICVPTPLKHHAPDLSLVENASREVGRHLRPGCLVVLESTTYPGTTEELVRPILERASGLQAGCDFALAYSPERIDPGQDEYRLSNTPKIVAGLTDGCRDIATSFYAQFVREVVTTSTPREAEMAKLIENTYRQVNIGLVNELAIFARTLGVDIWEALQAAATKPFGYQPFWPGPGVGGHCIAIDPSYLSWRIGQQLGYGVRVIDHANEVNNRMPEYVVSRIGESLNEAGRAIRGSKVLGLGVSYKAGVDDQRESPSLTVLWRLAQRGAEVSYHDPYVPSICRPGGGSLDSQELTQDLVASKDCVVILTAHPDIDYRMIVSHARLVFDCRGVTLGTNAPNVVRL